MKVVETTGGKIRPLDMMLKAALSIAGPKKEDESYESYVDRLGDAAEQVLLEVDEANS